MVHSNYEALKKNSSSVQEVQKDVKTMELEKEQINNKLDNVKRRVSDERILYRSTLLPTLYKL